MITSIKGDIFKADTEAIINTVNCEGIMGAGLALEFKHRFPDNYKTYREACKNNSVNIGRMFFTETNYLVNPKYIINFPTKYLIRNPSEISYIEAGLDDLKDLIYRLDIKSIAIPPLGCGLGGLDWKIIKPLIISYLQDIKDINIQLYEPL